MNTALAMLIAEMSLYLLLASGIGFVCARRLAPGRAAAPSDSVLAAAVTPTSEEVVHLRALLANREDRIAELDAELRRLEQLPPAAATDLFARDERPMVPARESGEINRLSRVIDDVEQRLMDAESALAAGLARIRAQDAELDRLRAARRTADNVLELRPMPTGENRGGRQRGRGRRQSREQRERTLAARD